MGILSVLLEWHDQDPPNVVERTRHEVVFAAKGNRNPFIAHPEWVACIFQGADCATIFVDGFESGDLTAWSSAAGAQIGGDE